MTGLAPFDFDELAPPPLPPASEPGDEETPELTPEPAPPVKAKKRSIAKKRRCLQARLKFKSRQLKSQKECAKRRQRSTLRHPLCYDYRHPGDHPDTAEFLLGVSEQAGSNIDG
jgi:hypothetical protein